MAIINDLKSARIILPQAQKNKLSVELKADNQNQDK